MAAYICGLAHMQKRERMSLEQSWKEMIERMRTNGQDDAYRWIVAGQRVVDLHNEGINDGHQIRFVSFVELDDFSIEVDQSLD